jgi:hypothetical protein
VRVIGLFPVFGLQLRRIAAEPKARPVPDTAPERVHGLLELLGDRRLDFVDLRVL